MDLFNINAISSQVVSSNGNEHVFFGVDNKYIYHSLITIMSLSENAGQSIYQFHIISSELDETDAELFIRVLAGTQHGLIFHHTGDNLFTSLPTTALFTRAAYYRLLAPMLVPDARRVLYLDADMVCLKSPAELWSIPMEEGVIALVVGDSDRQQPRLASNIGLKNACYFNSGMMLIDVVQWNNEHISEQVFNILNTAGSRFQYPDQDALNIVLEESVRYVDRRFNYIEMLAHDEQGYNIDVPADTCIVHYAGADKPWQEWNKQKVCQYYSNIYCRSPIAEQPFDLPSNHHQAKKMYKCMFRSHQFFRGIYWRIKYYRMRYL